MRRGITGAACVARHRMRRTASANTVTPIHLCHEKYFSLVGVKPGISVITQPSAKPHTISNAISQCKAMAVRVYDSRLPNEGLSAMTDQRKLSEVNGAARTAIPGADAHRIGAYDRTMPAAARAKAAMLPQSEKTGCGPLICRGSGRSSAHGARIEQLGTEAVRVIPNPCRINRPADKAVPARGPQPVRRSVRRPGAFWYYCSTLLSDLP